MNINELKRRDFIRFMTSAGAVSLTPALFTGCQSLNKKVKSSLPTVAPSAEDKVLLAPEHSWYKMMSYGDKINQKGEIFGFNNDFIATLPISHNPNEAFLWVNHESLDPLIAFNKEYDEYRKQKTKDDIKKEMHLVGGSLIRIFKKEGKWIVDTHSSYNARFDGLTPIPFNSGITVAGKKQAIGTLANCAGGQTPWGTFLTCEENYQDFYHDKTSNQPKGKTISPFHYRWHDYFNHPSEHYGWVVEINPKTKETKKLTGLGRFSHECATVVQLSDGRCAVYSGDDKSGECLYKFISSKPNSLDEGELFVANLEKGQWISLSLKKQPLLQKHFSSQLDVLIQCRKAASLVGGTPLDRPEDVEISPLTGDIFIALTNNKKNKNYHGSILKISETNKDYGSLTFSSETFLTGGEDNKFSCPDNFAFDSKGNFWFTTDMSGGKMHKPPYTAFGNNGLFYVPMTGSEAGQVFQIASAPVNAEFTGPCFSLDGKTLFLSVQHPGERSKDLKNLKSHWPDGGTSLPKPSIIAIQGPLIG